MASLLKKRELPKCLRVTVPKIIISSELNPRLINDISSNINATVAAIKTTLESIDIEPEFSCRGN